MSRLFRSCILGLVLTMFGTMQVVLATPSQAAKSAIVPTSDVITTWNTIAVRTIFAENATPIPSSGLYFGFVSIAVYDAVVAIEGGYRRYAYHGGAPAHASSEVAAASAAHRVLSHYFPASIPALDADYAAYLATVPDTVGKARGQRVGEASAWAIIRLRENDGRNAARTLQVTPGPGVWRPTPPALAPMLVPWLGFTEPLVLRDVRHIRLPGPNGLKSAAYAKEFAETKAYGASVGSSRSDEQTETALFWNANSVLQFQVAMRDQVTRRGLDIVHGARAFALLGAATADALIACWATKYDNATWRPITAIQLADTDGNPATRADPGWSPLVTTPPYPEYASGHACITGAATGTLSHLFGSKSIDLNVSSTVIPKDRHFDSAALLDQETMNARIWLGLHFRRAMIDGNHIGHVAARVTDSHYFQPTCWGW